MKMRDCIYRDEAIALLDCHSFESSYDAIWMEEAINELPAADVRPVVKCLECENALRDGFHKIVHCNQNGEHGYVWCKKEGCCRAEDFFCANGVSCSCGADI